MGKLNYSTRKISGTKAAQTVVKDVLKFLPSPTKRHLARDPHLEINLEGKLIGDDGFKDTCEAIATVLQSGVANLHEFNVSKNELTITGLLHLVPILAISSGMIRDLDLSGNKVSIISHEDEEKWEVFLMSFRKVVGLRHLNFSENPLGDRAIEIFSKVYIREKSICLSKLPREHLGHSDSDSDDGYDSDGSMEVIYEMARKMSVRTDGTISARTSTLQAKVSSPAKVSSKSSTSFTPEASMSACYLKRHGLRSVPFIVFSHTGITDLGAHHLSFIVGGHPKPNRLLRYHNGQKAAKLLTDKYKDPIYGDCNGIVYRPNELLTTDAGRLLAECESMRDSSLAKSNESATGNRTLNLSMKPGYSGRARRDSHSFLELPDNAISSLATELGRLRMKVQIKVLQDCGVSEVHLWKTALRTLVVARATLLEPPKKIVHIPPPPEPELESEGEIPDEEVSACAPISDPSIEVTDYSSSPEISIAVPVKLSYAQAVVKVIPPRRVFAVKDNDEAKPEVEVETMLVPVDTVVKDDSDYVEVTSPTTAAPALVEDNSASQFKHLLGCRMETSDSPSPSKAPAKASVFTPTPTLPQQGRHAKSVSTPANDRKKYGSEKAISTPIDDPPVIIHKISGKGPKSSRGRKASVPKNNSERSAAKLRDESPDSDYCSKAVINRFGRPGNPTPTKTTKSRAPGSENQPSVESIQTPKPKDRHITRGDYEPRSSLSRMAAQWPVSSSPLSSPETRIRKDTVSRHLGQHHRPRSDTNPLGYLSSPNKASPKTTPKVEQEPKLLGNLPFELWVKIIGLAADPHCLLSDRQLLYLCKWGKSRESLHKELLALGKLKHQQIWRILDGAACTCYE